MNATDAPDTLTSGPAFTCYCSGCRKHLEGGHYVPLPFGSSRRDPAKQAYANPKILGQYLCRDCRLIYWESIGQR